MLPEREWARLHQFCYSDDEFCCGFEGFTACFSSDLRRSYNSGSRRKYAWILSVCRCARAGVPLTTMSSAMLPHTSERAAMRTRDPIVK